MIYFIYFLRLNKRMEFGLIFHYGLYSVPGYDAVESARRRKTQNGSEWYLARLNEKEDSYRPISGYKQTQKFHKKNFKDMTYEDFSKNFADNLNMNQWFDIAEKLNVDYVLLTAKHHDGYCLWNTDTTEYKTDFDVIEEFSKKAKKKGFDWGFYYSLSEFGKNITKVFLDEVIQPQLLELIEYDPDHIWFDGHWMLKSKISRERVNELCKIFIEGNPYLKINDRIGNTDLASYRVFEDRFIPENKLDHEWQHITTIGLSWGYNRDQERKDYKTGRELYNLYQEVRDKNGYFLLNFGPKADGALDENELKSAEKFAELLN